MKKLDLNIENIINNFVNLKRDEGLAYLFEDSFNFLTHISHAEMLYNELKDNENILIDCAIVKIDEEFDYFNGQIVLRDEMPDKFYTCHHNWIEYTNEDLIFSKCSKCGIGDVLLV